MTKTMRSADMATEEEREKARSDLLKFYLKEGLNVQDIGLLACIAHIAPHGAPRVAPRKLLGISISGKQTGIDLHYTDEQWLRRSSWTEVRKVVSALKKKGLSCAKKVPLSAEKFYASYTKLEKLGFIGVVSRYDHDLVSEEDKRVAGQKRQLVLYVDRSMPPLIIPYWCILEIAGFRDIAEYGQEHKGISDGEVVRWEIPIFSPKKVMRLLDDACKDLE